MTFAFPQNTAHWFLPGPAGKLEVITQAPKESNKTIAVICHPHPQKEGTMHNKIVTTLSRMFESQGCHTVRFNYRGVQKSEGSYGNIEGECDDLRAVIAWLKQSDVSGYDIILAGFSFGAYISAKIATECHPKMLISIGPVMPEYPFAKLPTMTCPWIIVHGEDDEIGLANNVAEWEKTRNDVTNLMIMPGAGHFFHGKLIDLRNHLLSVI
ncbi:MAG: alpha/beta hydrolase [Gammaproteobacteria bacterium]